jgi:chromosomal replication initiation ATPase DnaA
MSDPSTDWSKVVTSKPVMVEIRDRIVHAVCTYFDVAPCELRGPRRMQHICQARFVVYYLLREDAKMSWCAIGRYLNKDHTTIMFGFRKAHGPSVEAIRGRLVAGEGK